MAKSKIESFTSYIYYEPFTTYTSGKTKYDDEEDKFIYHDGEDYGQGDSGVIGPDHDHSTSGQGGSHGDESGDHNHDKDKVNVLKNALSANKTALVTKTTDYLTLSGDYATLEEEKEGLEDELEVMTTNFDNKEISFNDLSTAHQTIIVDKNNLQSSHDAYIFNNNIFTNNYGNDIVEIAKKQNDYMRRRFSTKQSQYNYKIGQLHFLHNFTYALLWVYFILSAIYLAIVFVSPKRDQFSYQYKVIVLLVLVLFPFVITPIEYFVLRGLALIVETVVGNVFERDDYEYVVDHSNLPNFFSY